MPEKFEDILEICIENVNSGSANIEECIAAYPAHQAELREMLPLVVSLQPLKQIQPAEKFSRQAGQRLVGKLPDAPVTFWDFIRHIFTNTGIYSKRRFGMTQIIITIIVALSLLVGGGYSVQAAAPGDLLYKVDRGLEEIRLNLTGNPEKVIALRIRYATERLEEAEKLLGKGKFAEAVMAFEAYQDAITDAVDEGEVVEHEQGLNREAVRTMTQEDLAMQAGTLDRIRLSWDEEDDEHKARNAYTKAYQVSNWGIEWLLGPPEGVPQGPGEDSPGQQVAPGPQGPTDVDPNGPAPHGPTDTDPNGPAPQGPSEKEDTP
jgi:hypothetical protein